MFVTRRRPRLLLILIGVDLLVALLPRLVFDLFPMMFMYGLIVAQSGLLAAWTVFGQGRTFMRLGCAALLTSLLWIVAFRIFAVRFSEGIEPGVLLATSAPTLLHWIVVAGALAVAWRAFGWPYTGPAGDDGESAWRSQFGLRHLFAWMAGVAIVFALGRLVFVPIDTRNAGVDWELASRNLLLFGSNVALAVPCVLAGLTYRYRASWTIAIAAICLVLSLMVCAVVGSFVVFLAPLFVNATHAAVLLVCLLRMRRPDPARDDYSRTILSESLGLHRAANRDDEAP